MERPVLALFAIAILGPLIAGAILPVISDPGSALYIAGFALIGVAGIVAVAGVFYLVGRSEDRAREAERRGQRG
jgi:hypothetical protein